MTIVLLTMQMYTPLYLQITIRAPAIPAKMRSDTPLPTPNSVINSPIHMINNEPAVTTNTLVIMPNVVSSGSAP